MGRQHVVVSGNDAEVRRMFDAQLELVVRWQRGKAVGKVSAGHASQRPKFLLCAAATGEIGGAAGATAINNTLRDSRYLGMNGLGHDRNLPGRVPEDSIETPGLVDFLHYIRGALASDRLAAVQNGAMQANSGKYQAFSIDNTLRKISHSV
jgi:hypothetical protein